MLLLSVTEISAAPALWQETTLGMSVEEVRASFPEAAFPEEPDRLPKGIGEERLRLEEVRIIDRPFMARFYFNAEGLMQVTLAPHEKEPLHLATLRFDALTEALRAKYGPELATEHESDEFMFRKEVTWLSEGTTITLSILATDRSKSFLAISYSAELAEKAEAL